MLLLVIHNPSSGSESLSEEKVRGVFEDAGHEIRYQSLKKSGWKKSLAKPADAIVAVGGDGTVRRVAIAQSSNGSATTPLVIVPAGTANNLARHIGIDGPEERIAAGLSSARAGRLAIGSARKADEHETRFVESAGLGAFTRMLRKAEEKGVESMHLGLKLLRRAIEKAKPELVQIDADGSDLSGEYIMVEAMNVGSIGPRLLLAPDADHTDDRLDLIMAGADQREALLEYLDAFEKEDSPTFPITSRQARRVRIGWRQGHVDDTLWPSAKKKDEVINDMILQVENHLPLLIP